MKINVLFFVFLLFSYGLLYSNEYQKFDSYSLHKLNRFISQNNDKEKILKNSEQSVFKIISGVEHISLVAQVNSSFDFALLNRYGAKNVVRAGDVIAFDLPLDNLWDLVNDDGIAKVSIQRNFIPKLDSSIKQIKADLVHKSLNLPSAFKGKGVIVGIFDTGIDWEHPDFFDVNGTRILYIWDMTNSDNPKPPEGYSWGREYNKTEIDSREIEQQDYFGHGTHIAGIAVGNGRGASYYTGVAPESDIIVVKGIRDDFEASFTEGDVIAGCKYIIEKAKQLGKPCVINLSLGFSIGSHDGRDLLSKALDNLVENETGAVIVAAAGNQGDFEIHASAKVEPQEKVELLIFPINLCFVAPELCPDLQEFFLTGADIWADKGLIDSVYVGIVSREDFSLVSEVGFSFKDNSKDFRIYNQNDSLVALCSISFTELENGQNIFFTADNGGDTNLRLHNYYWSIVFKSKGDGNIDSWSGIPIGSQVPINTRFRRLVSDNFMTVSSPATAKTVVSVGSYVSKNKFQNIFGGSIDYSDFARLYDISSFSSRGPSRDGRILPIVVAPGEYVVSALSAYSQYIEIDSEMVAPTGNHIAYAGTSMAAPHVTGAIALLLQMNPNLNYAQIIELLKSSAEQDQYTGTTPNNVAGWGKLNVLRLLQKYASVDKNIEPLTIEIYPNPCNDIIYVRSIYEIETIEVFDFLGRKVATSFASEVDMSKLKAGSYTLKVTTSGKEFRKVVIKI